MANYDLLPVITEGKTLAVPHFPTAHQTLIFRLWEMVDAKRLAKVLETTEENGKASAAERGLGKQMWLSEWMSRGYISILRQVWHLLPYEQILKLLDCTEERLAFILKEDDFLGIKLGEKPDCKPVLWRELTDAEAARTAEIKEDYEKLIKPLYGENTVAPFDFYSTEPKPLVTSCKGDVTVDAAWGIRYPDDELLSKMVCDFKAFCSKYGTNLEGSERFIEIELTAVTDDAEYHEVHITKDGIRIRNRNRNAHSQMKFLAGQLLTVITGLRQRRDDVGIRLQSRHRLGGQIPVGKPLKHNTHEQQCGQQQKRQSCKQPAECTFHSLFASNL